MKTILLRSDDGLLLKWRRGRIGQSDAIEHEPDLRLLQRAIIKYVCGYQVQSLVLYYYISIQDKALKFRLVQLCVNVMSMVAMTSLRIARKEEKSMRNPSEW